MHVFRNLSNLTYKLSSSLFLTPCSLCGPCGLDHFVLPTLLFLEKLWVGIQLDGQHCKSKTLFPKLKLGWRIRLKKFNRQFNHPSLLMFLLFLTHGQQKWMNLSVHLPIFCLTLSSIFLKQSRLQYVPFFPGHQLLPLQNLFWVDFKELLCCLGFTDV